MTWELAESFAPDEFGYEDEFDLEGDDLDADDFDAYADELDWGRLLNTAATIGEGVYGNYAGKWGKKNKLWDSAIRGALGAIKGASKSWYQDGIAGDPFEPEYETEDIDAMEELAEDAIYGDPEEGAMAADELVARSFGPSRHAAAVRPVLMALRSQVRRILMAARRNPRLRSVARVAPLALRRTSVIVTRMAMSRRPVSVALALRIFRGLLTRLTRSSSTRMRAVAMARRRAARARGGYGPRRARGHGPRGRGVPGRSYPHTPSYRGPAPFYPGPGPARGGRPFICYPVRGQ